jgi:hypothetical protein
MAAPAAAAALLIALLAASVPALQAQTFVAPPVATTPLPRLRVVPGPRLTQAQPDDGTQQRSDPTDVKIPFLSIPILDADGNIVNASSRAAVELRAPVAGRQYIPPSAAIGPLIRPTDLVRPDCKQVIC